MKTIDRLINAYIQGSYLRLDGKTAGVQGESRMKTLRLHLSPEWLELTKKVLFMDAKGQNPVSVLLSSEVESYVNGTELVFDVLIPGEALAEEGECTFIVSGTAEDKQGYSVQGNLKVLPNDFYDVEPGNASTPTPTEMEQLQGYMDDILRQAGESTKEAVEKSEAAATRAENAQTAAETAKSAAETARAAAEDAKTAAETAKTAAESARNAAETAKSGAETARAAAEAAAAAAKNHAEEAATQASKAEAAATRAEAALQAVQTNASTAQTAANTAQTAASEAVTAKLAAQSAANSAAGYADAAAAAATRAENAATRAEGYAVHPPIPTEDGQFWQLWDGSQYVTTEYRAEGEAGPRGASRWWISEDHVKELIEDKSLPYGTAESIGIAPNEAQVWDMIVSQDQYIIPVTQITSEVIWTGKAIGKFSGDMVDVLRGELFKDGDNLDHYLGFEGSLKIVYSSGTNGTLVNTPPGLEKIADARPILICMKGEGGTLVQWFIANRELVDDVGGDGTLYDKQVWMRNGSLWYWTPWVQVFPASNGSGTRWWKVNKPEREVAGELLNLAEIVERPSEDAIHAGDMIMSTVDGSLMEVTSVHKAAENEYGVAFVGLSLAWGRMAIYYDVNVSRPGMVLDSPAGTRYAVVVEDDGTLSTVALS